MSSRLPELDWLPDAVCIVGSTTAAAHALPAAEAALVLSAVPRRRAHFAAGRACAHEALHRLGAATAELLREESGRARWPAGVVGSIAHCDTHAAAIVADDGAWLALGIDVEPLAPLPDDVAGYALTPDERARLPAPRPDGLDWALLAFCAKECVHKCMHPLRGAFLEFDEVEIDIRIEDCSFSPRPRSEAARVAFAGLRATGRWRAAEGSLFAVLGMRRET